MMLLKSCQMLLRKNGREDCYKINLSRSCQQILPADLIHSVFEKNVCFGDIHSKSIIWNNCPVTIFRKQILLLITGVLFVGSSLLEPIFHDHFEIEHTSFECMLCSGDVSTPSEFKHSIFYQPLLDTLSVKTNDPEISPQFNIFQSRAPPKI